MSAPTPLGAVLAGKYEVKRLIGRGGMGSVYEGVHVEIGKRVAIKLLETEHSKAEEISQRFRREGRAASRVESDHVVQVFDVGEDPTFGLYMVMEFLVGEDLATRLEREKLLDVPVAVDIAWQAARGLAKAHAAGVIHRDLKPGNVFLAERDDGSTIVKLVDFGISKLLVEETRPDSKAITRHGSAVGTPQYMSPEQAQGFPIDHRADVWALGAVLYEMVSGKQAYELLENYEQTIFAIVLRKPPPLSEVAPWVPPTIVAIIEQALEHDVDKRIPDCGTFAKKLADAGRALEGANRHPSHAPLALMRRTTGSNDPVQVPSSVVVIPPGGPPVVSRATSAATAPAMPSYSREHAERASSERGLAVQPPATVTGVAVKTGAHDSIEPGQPEQEVLAPRRSSAGAVAAVLLLGAIAAGAAFVLLNGNPLALPQSSGSPPATTFATEAPAPPPPPVLPSIDPLPSASATPAPSSTLAASASASAKSAPTGKPLVKAPPAGKPPVAAAASTSATTPPPKPPDDQFGGTGLSDHF